MTGIIFEGAREMTDKEWTRYANKQRQSVKHEPEMAKIRRESASLKWLMRKIKKGEKHNAELAI
jgi:hypothetical protein